MAEPQPPTPEPGAVSPAPEAAPQQPRGPSLHQIYALPAPIRTFPLPAFYPNNPISFFHVAFAWLGQWWSPPVEPSVVHQGFWSSTTFSVHITDEKTTRALWEQGFYGKGSLSRSEPNWLKREQVRRGLQDAHVSEILTVQRREERMRAKWERARLEQEAIRKTRLEEAQEAAAREASIRDAKAETLRKLELAKASMAPASPSAPVTPANLLALPNSEADLQSNVAPGAAGSSTTPDVITNGRPTNMRISLPSSPVISEGGSHKRRKSVRFSPQVESTTFNLTDPPSPKLAEASKADNQSDLWGAENANGTREIEKVAASESKPVIIENKEHLQLTPEEAFFLSFGLGALKVTDPANGNTLSTQELFTLFRRHSYFPPRMGPEEPELQPDDNFLVNYSVYHHFRSLGWVPRGGIKFGVDWLLYAKGPVFDHAEFGLIVIPSYTDPLWKLAGKKNPQKSWQWFHATLRVLSHVTKSLVLVYVDVPPPSKFDEALKKGFTDVFKLYKVREVMTKRWSSNRNR